MAGSGLRRVYRAAAITVATASVAAVGASYAVRPESQHTSYCAILPDSVGLYAGNPVTQMGYRIGKVKTITPGSLDVRVDFTVTERRPFPHDVKAIIRSTSILADRSLLAYSTVFPAAGSRTSSIEVSPQRLAELVNARWVEVCKLPE